MYTPQQWSAKSIFRCASISWFQVVSKSVTEWLIFFTASASTGLSDLFVACRFAVEMLGEEQGWTLKMFLAGSDAGVDFTGLIGPEPSPTDYDSVLRRFNGSPLFTALWWSNHCSIVTFFQRERRLDYIILVLSFCRDPNAALMEFARSWRYSFIRDMSPLNSEPKFSY